MANAAGKKKRNEGLSSLPVQQEYTIHKNPKKATIMADAPDAKRTKLNDAPKSPSLPDIPSPHELVASRKSDKAALRLHMAQRLANFFVHTPRARLTLSANPGKSVLHFHYSGDAEEEALESLQPWLREKGFDSGFDCKTEDANVRWLDIWIDTFKHQDLRKDKDD